MIKSFMSFLKESPVCFFAVSSLKKLFLDAGFEALKMEKHWELAPGGKYFTVVDDSAVFAFTLPEDLRRIKAPVFRMIGAHTDQPCLRIKPCGQISQNGYCKLGIEVYGGPIYNTWLDRPLSLAGRVTLKSDDLFNPRPVYVDLKKPVLVIPNLAIHMNREVNEGVKLNPQIDLYPVGGLMESLPEKEEQMLISALCRELQVKPEEILDFDLFTYITEEPQIVGFEEDMLSAAHLDDLVMVHTAATALIEARPVTGINVFCGFDHEEIGSRTRTGADSSTLGFILEKISLALGKTREEYMSDLMGSFLISGDVAHATHPAHPEKHDPNQTTKLGGGPVIKLSARQSYVTQSKDYSVYEQVCSAAGVPVQKFTNRSDQRGGSTIGPVTAGQIPCRIVDMGIAILAMHSARELMAVKDYEYTFRSFVTYYQQ